MNVHYKILAAVAMLSRAASTSDPAEPAVHAILLAGTFFKRNLLQPAMRAYSGYVAASSWSAKGCLTNPLSEKPSDI